jgi:signal transduction histidine kinase
LSALAQSALDDAQQPSAAFQHRNENLTNGLGSWIWDSRAFDRQWCQFWREFEVPDSARVVHAQLRMTVDNEYTLFLDGRELGHGAEWREVFDYDLTALMASGKHVFGVEAFNTSREAGMIFGLRIELADGRLIEVKSDRSWRIVPTGARGWKTETTPPPEWQAATIMAPLGGSPWTPFPVNVNEMPTLQPIKIYFWQTGWFQLSLLAVCAVAVLVSLRLVAQLAMHRKERWLLQQERARIARDIHDDVGSRMTQLVLHGEVAKSELPHESPMRPQLDKICEEARDVLSTMDEILWAVNPKRDTFGDFASYVCGYAQSFLRPTSIQCLFDVAPAMSAVVLDLPLRRTLLMVIKETLNNAVKYSEATELRLQIFCQGQNLVVVVSDNGRGFDASKTKQNRNGLSNMTQRMREVAGICRIESRPGQGCRTELVVPLRPGRWHFMRIIWERNRFGRRNLDPHTALPLLEVNNGSEINHADQIQYHSTH